MSTLTSSCKLTSCSRRDEHRSASLCPTVAQHIYRLSARWQQQRSRCYKKFLAVSLLVRPASSMFQPVNETLVECLCETQRDCVGHERVKRFTFKFLGGFAFFVFFLPLTVFFWLLRTQVKLVTAATPQRSPQLHFLENTFALIRHFSRSNVNLACIS